MPSTVTDTLPAGVSFASASPPCAYAAGAVTCPEPSLTAGINLTFTDRGHRAIQHCPKGHCSPTTVVAAAAEDGRRSLNNSSTVTTSVLARADLTLAKWAPGATVFAGDQLTYTLAITNAGPSDAASVNITDVLPAGVALVSAPSGWSSTGVTLTGSLGAMTALASQQFTVVVDLPSSTPAGVILTNTAERNTGTTDPDGGNNLASTHTTVQTQADLAIAKVRSARSGLPGQPAHLHRDRDQPGPVGRSLDGHHGRSAGRRHVPVAGCQRRHLRVRWAASVTCTLASPASPGVYTVTLHTTVSALNAGYLTNTAGVTSATADPDPANSVVQLTTLAQTQADLSIAKAASASTVFAGESLTYTLTVTNASAHAVNSVVVTDALPAGVSAVNAARRLARPLAADVSCDAGRCWPPAPAKYVVLPVRVDPSAAAGQITNTAGITSTTNSDPTPGQ